MLKKLDATYRFQIACVAAIALFLSVAAIYNFVNFFEWLLMVIYQVFCIAVPGFAFMRIIRFPCKNQIMTFGFSYAFGYCINILCYIVLIPLSWLTDGWMIGIPILAYLVAAASLAYLVWLIVKGKYKDLEKECAEKKETRFFFCLWITVFLIYFVFSGIPTRMPMESSERVYYADTLYWLGNALSLSNGFPPLSMRELGHTISYHYFSSIQFVVIEKCTGIGIPTLGLAFSYIQSTTLITFGFYSLFTRFYSHKGKIFLSFVLLILSMGVVSKTSMYYVSHVLISPFGYDYSIGLLAFSLIILCRIHKKECSFTVNAVAYLILMTICLGTKAPAAVILLAVEGLLCLYWLLKRNKDYKWYKIVTFGCCSLLLFGATYLAFMSNTGSWFKSASESSAIVEEAKASLPLLSWKGTSEYAKILKAYYETDVPVILKPLLAVGVFTAFVVLINMAIMFLFVTRIIFMIRNRKTTDPIQWIFVGATFAGIFMTLFLSMVGFSQVYFTDAVLPLAILVGMYRHEGSKQRPRKLTYAKWGTAVMLSEICVLLALNNALPVVTDTVSSMKEGKVSISSSYVLSLQSNVVTPEEAEGYYWIRDNTEDDAVLITNATVKAPNPLMTNVFTERRMLMESNAIPSVSREEANVRYERMLAFMNRADESAYRYMLEKGVDYVIILTKYKTGNEYTKNLECVYRNSGIEIYKL